MKNKVKYLALIMAGSVALTACGTAKQVSVSEPMPEEKTVEEVPAAEPEMPKEEIKEEPKEKVENLEEPDNLVEPQFTEDFDEVTDYSQYLEGSTVKSGSRIWIQGKVTEYNPETKSIIVKTKDGDWNVSVGANGTDDYYKLVEKTVDQFVRIFGVYTEYDKELGLPSMAFQPNDYQKYAFRLESVDNNFRLTQTDYTVSMPEFDQEETFVNIIYKMPSVWTKDSSDNGFYYRYPEETLSSFVMYNYIDNANSGFDEVSEDKILSDLADSYAGEDDTVMRKESFKLAGYPALCFEMSFTPDGYPIPLSMFCYMFIVENQYYFYGVTEPYLVGETSKQLLANLLSDVKYNESEALNKADDANVKTDEKASLKDDASAKTETPATDRSAEKADDTKTDKKTETTAPAEEPVKEEAKKPAHPPKSEIENKIFTQHMKGTLSGEKDGQMISAEMEDDLPINAITSDMLTNYNEATGTCSYTAPIDGVNTTLNFTFSYDSNGTIVYSAPVNYTNSQYSFTGTMSGHLYQ